MVTICPRFFNNQWNIILYLWAFIILTVTAFIFLNSVKKLIFVMARCGVLFEVRTEFLNIVYTSFGFKGLMLIQVLYTQRMVLIMFIIDVY
jgi:hypothetical protein